MKYDCNCPRLCHRNLLNSKSLDRQHYFPEEIRFQLRLIAWISLGMFLFMLFFLPFEHKEMEFNDSLLFITGLGVISFIVMGIFRIILPSTLNRIIKLDTYKISNEVLIVILVWVFNALGYIFYLKYVGAMESPTTTVFRVIIFTSIPSIILKLADVNKSLRDQLKRIVERNIRLGKHVSDEDILARPAEVFYSDSKSDKVEIPPDDIIVAKSADNYVNLIYKEKEEVRQKMLRTTLKQVHEQLRKHPEFLKCHRTHIVNSLHIVNLTNSYKGYRLKLLDYEEEIPVSRQYILTVKEYIDAE